MGAVYLRQDLSENTGAHSVIMLRTLHDSLSTKDNIWSVSIERDFKQRLMTLLGGTFRSYHPLLVLSLLEPKNNFYQRIFNNAELECLSDKTTILENFSMNAFKRLQAYSNNKADFRLILDLLPSIAHGFFTGRLPLSLSFIQAVILVSLGLQHRSLSSIEKIIELPIDLILALLNDLISKVVNVLRNHNVKRISK